MEVKNYFATDTQGNVLGSAQVYLYLAGTTTLATGLQNISGAALGNPFTSDINGLVQFKAPDGNYDLRVVKPGREFTIRIQCFDGVAFQASIPELLVANNISADGTNLGEQLLLSRKIEDYASLRSYTGNATRVEITRHGNSGAYDNLGAVGGYTDSGGLIVISSNGTVWRRDYQGNVQAEWFQDGTITDDVACSRAAKAAPAYAINSDNDYPLNPYCLWAEVDLSARTWTFTEEVDTGNREIVYNVPVGCRVIGVNFMNGRVNRSGNKLSDASHGILDSATGMGVMCNGKLDEMIPTGGLGTPSRLSAGNGRDTTALYAGNRVPAPVYSADDVVSYSANGVVLSTPMSTSQLRRLRVGMIVQTKHSTRYAGMLTSWTSSTLTFAAGWFLVDGAAVGTPTTPTGTTGLDVNVFRKAWALNANGFIDAGSYGNEVVGAEFGVSNAKGESTGMGGSIATYCAILASLKGSADDWYNTYASITGGRFVNGYTSIGGTRNAFIHRGDLGRADEIQNLLTGTAGTGITFFNVDALGSMEVGRRGGAVVSPWRMDMHSSGNTNDYDGYMSCTGGTSANGAGIIALKAGQVTIDAPAADFVGVPRPSADNVNTLGQASRRFTTVFASTGTINTSDETLKTSFSDFNNVEIAALNACFDHIGLYQWLDEVAEKGASFARLHGGVPAQKCVSEFESRGLDPWRYAWFCRDRKVVQKRETVKSKRQAFDTKEEVYEEIEIINGNPVLTRKSRIYQIPKVELKSVINQDGSAAKTTIPEVVGYDDSGNPVIDMVEVDRTCYVPVMEDFDEEVIEEVETGDYIYSLRHSELIMAMIKAARNGG